LEKQEMSEGIIIALVGFFSTVVAIAISFRTTSFNELKSLLADYKKELEDEKEERKKERANYNVEREQLIWEIKKIKEDNEAKDKLISDMAQEIKNLERQNDNYKQWMTQAIAEINRVGGTPPPMV
jgi:septal ring factor EnvC (AmiA/AmiB activator)